MMRRCKKTVLFGLAVAVAFSLPVAVQAAPFPNGAGASFTYDNGGDLNGRFGTPVAIGDTLFFGAVSFGARSDIGNTYAVDSQDDTLQFDIHANAGQTLSFVRVTLFGSYATQKQGDMVTLTSDFSLEELSGLGRTFNSLAMGTSIPFPFVQPTALAENGVYTGNNVADVSFSLPGPASDMQLVMTTEVIADAVTDGFADITATFQQMEFEFIFIPEPTTLALLGLGGLVALRRRRRA